MPFRDKNDNNQDTISTLLLEMSTLKRSLEEKDKLNMGLASALRKSRQIEASTKNLYQLKMQRAIMIYRNLSKTLEAIQTLYPYIKELDGFVQSFHKFAETFESSTSATKDLNMAVHTENDTIRLLLDKVSAYAPAPQEPAKKSVNIKRKDSKNDVSKIEKVLQNVNKNLSGADSPAEEFLKNGKAESNAYSKMLSQSGNEYLAPNESGFDLREAVNPKDDLDEIMKAFDFD